MMDRCILYRYVDGGSAPSPEDHLDPNIDWATPDSVYRRAFGKL